MPKNDALLTLLYSSPVAVGRTIWKHVCQILYVGMRKVRLKAEVIAARQQAVFEHILPFYIFVNYFTTIKTKIQQIIIYHSF